MEIDVDEAGGRRVGSRVRIAGRVFGMSLAVEEVVTERVLPRRKVWKTIDQPHLLVIGHYQMGFEITPRDDRSRFRVFIDYALPESLFGRLFSRYDARWCSQRMVSDAVKHFEETSHGAGSQSSKLA